MITFPTTVAQAPSADILRTFWAALKPRLVGLGCTFAAFAAAQVMVPDHAVMTKQELNDNVELSKTELAIRKAAVILIIHTLINLPQTTINIGKLFTTPGLESKLRATAQLLKSAPGFYMAYTAMVKKYKGEDLSLSIRDYTDNAPKKTLGAAHFIGSVASDALSVIH